VDLLNKILGRNIQPEFLPESPGDIFKSLADVSKAEKLVGYKPQINFEQGLKLTVEYFKNAG
jgi:nucleoside-diphosphate-sugar epimerase